MPEHAWVIAWIENYHSDPRIEPRRCEDVEEAVELALSFEESDDHHVADIETPDGVLSAKEKRQIQESLRAKWDAEWQQHRAVSQPCTHGVDVRIPKVIPALPEDWRNWTRVRSCLSEREASEFAAGWIEKLGADRVRIRELRVAR